MMATRCTASSAKLRFDRSRFRIAALDRCRIPVGPLLDFALPSHLVNIVDGNVRNVDGRIYAFVDPDGTTHTHTSLRADLAQGKIYIAGMTSRCATRTARWSPMTTG